MCPQAFQVKHIVATCATITQRNPALAALHFHSHLCVIKNSELVFSSLSLSLLHQIAFIYTQIEAAHQRDKLHLANGMCIAAKLSRRQRSTVWGRVFFESRAGIDV